MKNYFTDVIFAHSAQEHRLIMLLFLMFQWMLEKKCAEEERDIVSMAI